jgi:uncharacterized protein (DUF2249 family)
VSVATRLDVRSEAPAGRHELMLETHFAPPVGEVTWEPVETGPETWRVRIGRLGPPA